MLNACMWCAHVVRVSMRMANTQRRAWNIKRWRWRCPRSRIGWGCVIILSRAMSCGNSCLAHPLITSMFTTPSPPPATITLVFPLSKWPSCLKRFLLLIAAGEYSLDVQQGPNSFKLLPLTNSDFRGFHSWVDTDVLVSAIMGPLSFHANWSEKAKRLPAQTEREKSINYSLSFSFKEQKVITRVHKFTTYHNYEGYRSDEAPDEMVVDS